MGRPDGAMVGTIVKPSIGLSPAELGELVGELAAAGVDFIKDDELQGNGPTRAAGRARPRRHAGARTARRPHRRQADVRVQHHRRHRPARGEPRPRRRGRAARASWCASTSSDSPGSSYIRRRAGVPIHGHRTMFGAISRSEQVGLSFRAWQKLVRLSGADHLHTNGISNKFYESDADVLDSIAAVREPLLGLTPTVPVLSSGQWGGLAHATYAAVGTTDLLVLAGRRHPRPSRRVRGGRRRACARRGSRRRGASRPPMRSASSAALRRATEIVRPGACLTVLAAAD